VRLANAARNAAGVLFFVALLIGCPRSSDKNGPVPAIDAGSLDSAQDRAHAVQALLDSPWIQNALEKAEDGKSPLVVVVPAELANASLHAFGKSVQVLSPAQAQSQRPESYLELLDVRVQGERAHLTFRDEAEQVNGEAQLERTQGGWRVAQVTGSER
jgi:hypothetical protein